MSDYQEISEQIRAYVGAKGQNVADGLPDLAVGYANLCREANARLRRCGEYLRKGMRSEAIHLADCQPNLFQLVESLQIPEQQEWARICASHGLPIPPPLSIECVDDLKEAYAIEHELLPLLSRHRVLALAHAKLSSRLEVLRLLVDADPDNTCWIGEIRSLEAARLNEMQEVAKTAVRAKDKATLKRLADELHGHPWLCDIPDDLSQTLAIEGETDGQAQSLSELRGLAAKLQAAHRARTADEQAFSDVQRWHEITNRATSDLPPELLREAGPALAWLAAEKSETGRSEPDDLKPSEQMSHQPDAPAPKTVRIDRVVLAALGLVIACAGAAGWFFYYRATHLR